MPNHIQCRLTAPANVLDSLKGETECDFNAVIPMPPELHVEAHAGIESAAQRALLDFPAQHYIPDVRAAFDSGNFGSLADNLHLQNMMNTKITPPPLTFKDGEWRMFIALLENKRKHGHYSWYSWSIDNWGTKWNAYKVKRQNAQLLEFQTAWSAPFPVVTALSFKSPGDRLTLEYADEDYGSNFGIVQFIGGTPAKVKIENPGEFIRGLWAIPEDEWREMMADSEVQP